MSTCPFHLVVWLPKCWLGKIRPSTQWSAQWVQIAQLLDGHCSSDARRKHVTTLKSSIVETQMWRPQLRLLLNHVHVCGSSACEATLCPPKLGCLVAFTPTRELTSEVSSLSHDCLWMVLACWYRCTQSWNSIAISPVISCLIFATEWASYTYARWLPHSRSLSHAGVSESQQALLRSISCLYLFGPWPWHAAMPKRPQNCAADGYCISLIWKSN